VKTETKLKHKKWQIC